MSKCASAPARCSRRNPPSLLAASSHSESMSYRAVSLKVDEVADFCLVGEC